LKFRRVCYSHGTIKIKFTVFSAQLEMLAALQLGAPMLPPVADTLNQFELVQNWFAKLNQFKDSESLQLVVFQQFKTKMAFGTC
jgi:hypothetical protein